MQINNIGSFVMPFTWDCLSKPREFNDAPCGRFNTKVLVEVKKEWVTESISYGEDEVKTQSLKPVTRISDEGQSYFDRLVFLNS